MKLENGTKLKQCKGYAEHVCEVLLPVFKSAPQRCGPCKDGRETEVAIKRRKRRREENAVYLKASYEPPTPAQMSEKIISAVKFGRYNYEIRDQYGVSDEDIRKIVCSHYQRRAKIGEPA